MITKDILHSRLNYDRETGVFTRKVATGLCGRFPVGSTIGYSDNRGCVSMRIDGRLYRAHRLAWLYVTGAWPADEIDHINGNPSDNRFVNLREASRSQNGKNLSQKSSNTVGLKGVHIHKQTGKWRARIAPNGRSISLGLFDCPAAAHFAHVVATHKYFGEFARAS